MPELRSFLDAFDPRRMLFDPAERTLLDQRRHSLEASTLRTVAYSVYENRFGRAGGVFPVALNATFELSHTETVLALSPYHRRLANAPVLSSVARIRVPFGRTEVEADLLEHLEANGVPWYLISAEGYFDAEGGPDRSNPYGHESPTKLLVDSLFFCQAIPLALAALGHRENLIVHAQDWEAASTALTVSEAVLAGRLKSASVVLTLHNSYDHPLGPELNLISDRAKRWPKAPPTVLSQMLPLLNAPASTVSRAFAQDLRLDPLQTRVFAPHLQAEFSRQPPLGISNGYFGRDVEPFSPQALLLAQRAEVSLILQEKQEKRRALLDFLEGYTDPRQLGSLDPGTDGRLADLDPRIPIFCMFGRLDPGQKGFDVLLRVIQAWPRGSAKFLLTPSVGNAGSAWVEDFARVASQRAGDVLVFPFRMAKGYAEILSGSSFAVFPSLFEPFGGVSEPYFAGTPVVARATGGLLEQVVDVEEGRAVATGILYREAVTASQVTDLPLIQAATSPEARAPFPTYQAWVGSLAEALERATRLHQDKARYGAMLANLAAKARAFCWQDTVRGYHGLYELSRLRF